MKKAILFGFGFTVGARLANLACITFDRILIEALAGNDKFMAWLEENEPKLAKKIEMLRRK